jgi:hypothetical protein
MRFNFQNSEIKAALMAKENSPGESASLRTRCGVDKFLGGLPSLLAELQRHSGVISCINS